MSISPESYPRLTFPGQRENTDLTQDSVSVPQPLDGIERDLTVALSNYDFSWRQLPYGSGWDAFRIRSLVERLVSIKFMLSMSSNQY